MGKKIRKKNGGNQVKIYSKSGSYHVYDQRYILEDGSHTSYLRLYGGLVNGQYSPGLATFIEDWSNEVSFRKLSELLGQLTGPGQITQSGISSYLERRAEIISGQWLSSHPDAPEVIEVSSEIDIYDKDSEEAILMMDDVGVKAQKPHKKVARKEGDARRIDTTVVLIQDKQQNYHFVTEGINKKGECIYPIEKAIADKVYALHGTAKPVKLVAITDGARSIRLSLQKVFGEHTCIILDWYHLQHKVGNLMSMIAKSKKDKEAGVMALKELLWEGKTAEAIAYADNIEHIKNPGKLQEMKGFLLKHQHEIIDYKKRQEQGKTIGSGRGEKANDLIVAHRQKKKGMAWSNTGSKALAIIKVNNLQTKVAQDFLQ